MYCLRYLFVLCVINSLLFLNGDSSSRALEDEAQQMGIHALGWNGSEWLIGGNTLKVFQDGFTPHPLLVKYSKNFADISSQLDIEDTIIDRISWNGQYFLICYSFHEYGGLLKYDGYQVHHIPLPGEPLSLRVTTLDWNGEYWLIGSSYVGYGYLVAYDGVTITDVSSFFSGIKSIAWMKDSWLLSGINPDRVEILAKYDGDTFTEIEKPDFLGSITNSQWNGEYVLMESDGNLIQFDGIQFVDTGFSNQVSSLAWNGEYWLLGGGKGMLTMYNGEAFTDLTLKAGIDGRIQALEWNGEYWLLGDSTGVLKMYDGEEFTDLTSQFKDAVYTPSEPEQSPPEQENAFNSTVIGIIIILFVIFLSYFLVKKKHQ